MSSNSQRADIRIFPTGGNVRDLPLHRESWRLAHDAFLSEDYETSLREIRRALNTVPAHEGRPIVPVPAPGEATVKDGVVLCARCLFQLDRYEEFEVLQASAGRWGLVPDRMPDLDVVNLAFACKRGRYCEVVNEATEFIDGHRHDLPPVIAHYLHLRGFAYSHLGEPGMAREDIEAAYSLFKVLKEHFDSARAANLLGILDLREGRFPASERWFKRALAGHTRLGMLKNMGGNHLNLGILAYKQGELGRAMVAFEAGAGLLKSVDAQVSLCRLDIARGNTLRLMRNFPSAREHLLNGYEAAGRLALSREEALALEFLGDVARDESLFDRARRYYSRALAIAGAIAPEGDVVMEVMRRQGEALRLMGRPSEALPVLQRALVLARHQGDNFEEAVICRVLAGTMLDLGDLDSAAGQAGKAVDSLRDLGGRHELMLALRQRAEVLVARTESGLHADPGGMLEQAWQDAMCALDLALKAEIDHWILTGRCLLNTISDRRNHQERDGEGESEGRPTADDPVRIIHVSSVMRDVIQLADAFAESREPVLITGATGTGKDLLARRLHQRSPRRHREFVCVNVAAVGGSMFAREFFGHVRGAFTGAEADAGGFAALADGGTLFLDEIGDLPLDQQPQLLRLLQDGAYQAVGDPRERRTDLRLIAATNADLKQLVAEGRFRADLYYRLKILELKIPSLQRRREDVLPLLKHFLTESAGHPVELGQYFNDASQDQILCHHWPGNVREVAMVARQAHAQLSSRGTVCVELETTEGHPMFLNGPQDGQEVPTQRMRGPVARSAMGRARILTALADAAGNRAEAARRLGVSRSTLYRRMEKLGIACKVLNG